MTQTATAAHSMPTGQAYEHVLNNGDTARSMNGPIMYAIQGATLVSPILVISETMLPDLMDYSIPRLEPQTLQAFTQPSSYQEPSTQLHPQPMGFDSWSTHALIDTSFTQNDVEYVHDRSRENVFIDGLATNPQPDSSQQYGQGLWSSSPDTPSNYSYF